MSRWDKGYRNFDSLDEMRETILTNLNKVVGPDDYFIFGGDGVFGMDKPDTFRKFWERVICKNIIYIQGNHDDWFYKKGNLVEVERLVGKVSTECYIDIEGEKYNISHYAPEDECRKIKREPDTIYLYGHYHNTLKDDGFGMDVGVDTSWNGHKPFTPYSFPEIMEIMKSRGFQKPKE